MMSAPIAAVSGSPSSVAPTQSQASGAAWQLHETISLRDAGAIQEPSNSALGQTFQNILSSFQTETAQYDATKSQAHSFFVKSSDPVDVARAAFLPQKTAASAPVDGANEAKNTNNAGVSGDKFLNAASDALRGSFDHALFVTLVSQVVSGVGQTMSTLIKQQ